MSDQITVQHAQGLPGGLRKFEDVYLPPNSVIIQGTRMNLLSLQPKLELRSASDWPWAAVLWRGPLKMGAYESEYVGIMPKGIIVVMLTFSGDKPIARRFMSQIANECRDKSSPIPSMRPQVVGVPISIRSPAQECFRFIGEMRLGSTCGTEDCIQSVSLTGFSESDRVMYPDDHFLPSVRAKFTPEQLSGEVRPDPIWEERDRIW